jgi:DNA modification methylase
MRKAYSKRLGVVDAQLERKNQIVYRPISELKPDSENPRRHPKEQVRKVAASISKFGFASPILIDANSRVIAGHCRLEAARQLGWDAVPTVALTHLSEVQARALALADNQLATNATWDSRLLGEQLKMLSDLDLDFTLEDLGFETTESDLLIQAVDAAAAEDRDPADQIPADSGPPVSRPGDLWNLGSHCLYCGNALEEASYATLMGGKKAAMVYSDPPYNTRIEGNVSGLGKIKHTDFLMASGEMSSPQFTQFLAIAFRLMANSSVDGALHFHYGDWRHMGEYLTAGRSVYSEFKHLIVWDKGVGAMGSLYRNAFELIFLFKHGRARHRNNIALGRYGRNRINIWRVPGLNSLGRATEEGNLLALHPTVKPVALGMGAMLDCSARGDIVLDAFAGSGSTLIAAERTGRIAYCMELDPRYVDTILRRYIAYTGDRPRHAQSGKFFDELERQRAKKGGRRG